MTNPNPHYKRNILPGLQVPSGLDPEVQKFLQGLKEHIEQYGGANGKPKERFATLSDLERAGLARVVVKGGRGELRPVEPSTTVETTSRRGELETELAGARDGDVLRFRSALGKWQRYPMFDPDGAVLDGRIVESNVTQHEEAIDHDALLNYVDAEHIDWSVTGIEVLHQNRFGLPSLPSDTPELDDLIIYWDVSTGTLRQTRFRDLPWSLRPSVLMAKRQIGVRAPSVSIGSTIRILASTARVGVRSPDVSTIVPAIVISAVASRVGVRSLRLAQAWTPADITTALWLDGTDNDTLTLDGSSQVSQWVDKSGNTRTFTQGTSGSRPTLTTLNGLQALAFANDFLISTAVASTWSFLHDGTNHQIYMVFRPGSVANPNTLYGLMGTGTGSQSVTGMTLWWEDRSAFSFNDTVTHHVGSSPPAVLNNVADNGSFLANTVGLLAVESDPDNGVLAQRSSIYNIAGSESANNTVNGVASTSAAPNTLRIGAFGNSGNTLTGAIGEIVVRIGSFDTDIHNQIVGYLAHRWGLETQLPADHPYKSSPP